ncbi:hypothetical protein C8N43_0412 [Litoreibacter ponti]|uniref:Uncharacterized protein n=1 Tax=Litoreibacter ponti TaxID=1510457 RepID=A0A2T6BI79_9RHOB|nr:hypothetical protein [Litoreibacter ponti]PTX55768.1 hypothetical protein C8N43_0412 [Litoreibacter ponti]
METLKIKALAADIKSHVDDVYSLSDAGLQPEATAELVEQASRIVEVSAYLLARSELGQPVTELMLISSRLEHLAQHLAGVAA